MTVVSIELTDSQISFLERLQDAGDYNSRSEAIRDLVRRAEFDWAWKQGITEVKKKGLTLEDLEKTRKKIAKKLVRERFSDVL